MTSVTITRENHSQCGRTIASVGPKKETPMSYSYSNNRIIIVLNCDFTLIVLNGRVDFRVTFAIAIANLQRVIEISNAVGLKT